MTKRIDAETRPQESEAEERLRRAEAVYHKLVDAVSDYAIFLLDATGHVATWNAGAEKTKGYKAGEIIGKHFSIFYTPEDRAIGKPDNILRLLHATGRYEEEGWRVRKDGSRFWASVVITALHDESGAVSGFAKVTRDLTQRRQAEENERRLLQEQVARAAAQEAARTLEEANRVKDEFLATVSHELRTPLNAILGWAKLLTKGVNAESYAKGVEVIRRNAEAQARIIDDILDVSRIITGKFRLDVQAADLGELARDALDVVRPSADAKRVILDLACPHPVVVAGDPERLRQVIWNLLSNAVRFTDAGGSITVHVGTHETNAVLSVEDTGHGIEPNFLPFVFDRFQQADSSTARRHGGLGLGLAIVRHIVELHGGHVLAESEGIGRGARFTVSLPIRAVAKAVVDAAPTSEAHAPPPGEGAISLRGLRILVVDDDPDARDIVEQIFTDAGAETRLEASAAAGLEAVPSFLPHVVVSDVGMPNEDGYSFMRRMRKLPQAQGGGAPSIALTAYTRAYDRTRALAAGFTTHIAKPVDPRDLVAAVANLAAVTRR